MQKISVVKEEVDFRTEEAYKTLRTNVSFAGEDIKVIGITSCMPNEGKSTTSLELAKSFSEEGKRTLLIDADLRKSEMKKIIAEGKVSGGMTEFLSGKAKIMDVLVETDIPNFFIIFAGHSTPNPSELLGNEHFKSLIEAARKSFDVIIIDTPPIGSVIDSAIISKQCDGMVVVMRFASVSYQMAKRLKTQLEAAGAKILGVVLNAIGGKNKQYGRYGRHFGTYYEQYYLRYYKKYYGEYYGKNYGKGYGGTYGKYGNPPKEEKE